MSNPVFDRIDKDVRRGGYAGFGGRPAQDSSYGQAGQYGAYQDEMSARQMEELFSSPSATAAASRKLTVDDVVMKSLGLFAVLLVFAAATGFLVPLRMSAVVVLPAIVATLVLGIVIAVKKSISVPLIVAYAAAEGVLVGAVTAAYGARYDGVVSTAVVATLSVFAAMFFGWKTGFVKVTERTRRIFGLAIAGYLIFALVNLVAALVFGASSGWGFFGFGSVASIAVSVFAVGLASYSLALDFDSIDRAVAAQLPEKTSWLLAHGLLVTLVWLYLEMLRLIAQLTGRD